MNQQQIEKFYSAQVEMRLKFFVNGNKRISRAWETLTANVTEPPKNILEVGCSIGAICWQMGMIWPNAQITGLDLTRDYIEVGNKLFGSPKLKLIHGTLPYSFSAKFDLIVLMDVYEHISLEHRNAFNLALKEILTVDGLVFLSFPTVRSQTIGREQYPDRMQPVDEDIALPVLSDLAATLEKDVLLYKEISVYHTGDYAHCILGSHGIYKPLPKEEPPSFFIRGLNRLNNWRKPIWMKRKYRERLVSTKLMNNT